MSGEPSGRTADRRASLSASERRIAELIAAGYTDEEIASAMQISVRTVRTKLRHIRDRTGLGRRAEIAAYIARSDDTHRDVVDSLEELGLLCDETIDAIAINGHDVVFLDRSDGTREMGPPVAADDLELIELLRNTARRRARHERRFDEGAPSFSLQLPDGSQMFAVAWVSARPQVTIRRSRLAHVTLSDLERLGAINGDLRDFLAAAVRARKRIVIAGGPRTGKTTLLRALTDEIPSWERVVTVEDEFELGIDHQTHPNCVALQARVANVEGSGAVTTADLIRMSLRMRPDRLILGEIRGAEAIAMLTAMSQGQEGSMTTVCADSVRSLFHRLALCGLQAPERLPIEASNLLTSLAVDLVLLLERGAERSTVSRVHQVAGFDGEQVLTNQLFGREADGQLARTMSLPSNLADELGPYGYDGRAAGASTGRQRPALRL